MRNLLRLIVIAFASAGGAAAQGQTLTEKAAIEHEAMCRSGDGGACWVVGRWHKGGVKLQQDRAKAAGLLKRSCDLGYADGCAELADLQLSEGDGYDPAAAIAYYDRKCRSGGSAECYRLGELYFRGQPGVASDPAKARGYAELACNAGSIEGCRIFASMAAQGQGGAADMAAALRGTGKACELNDAAACMTVAQLSLDADAPDPQRAAQFAEKACSLNNADGCLFAAAVAVTQLSPPDGQRAARMAEKGCALKNPVGCLQLAQLYSDGTYLPADKAKGKDAAIRACELKSPDGCQAFLMLAETKAEAAAGLNALCNLKQFDACMEFGRMAEEGDGIARDNLRAMLAYKAALKLDPGHAEARKRYEDVSKKPIQ